MTPIRRVYAPSSLLRHGTGLAHVLCSAALGVLVVTAATSSPAAVLGGRAPGGFEETFGLTPELKAKDYTVQLIASSAPANVFWPGDEAAFTLQFVNTTDAPIKAEGKIEVVTYVTLTGNDVFAVRMEKTGEAGTVPVAVDLAPKGFSNVRVKVPLPERFGPYALVVDLPGHGRQFAAGSHSPPQTAGRCAGPRAIPFLRHGHPGRLRGP